MRRRLHGDYQEVNAPQLLDKSLWETSGHWGWFRENMFQATSAGDETEDERVFAIKPMNCPGHIQIFKHGLKSYRDLPMRLAEFGIVHRYEPSGALHGLLRVRAFTQDDAHVFCTEEQMADECLKINDLILSTYADFGFEEVVVKLSTRPEKRVGTDAMWDHGRSDHDRACCTQIESAVRRAHQDRHQSGRRRLLRPEVRICAARRHRPRLAMRHDAGRLQPAASASAPSISTPTAQKTTPVMIHRAICGSMERFLGVVIEHYAGHLPLWLAPMQAVVATITSDADDYARGGRAARATRRPARRGRSAQREDQLQGARAFAREDPGRCSSSARRKRPSAWSRSAGSAAKASRWCRSTPRLRCCSRRRRRRTCGGRGSRRRRSVQNRRPRSRAITRAALWPGAPVTPPPGCVPEPQ